MSTQTQIPPPEVSPQYMPVQRPHTGGREVVGYPVPRQSTAWLPLFVILAIIGAPILFAAMNTVTGFGICLIAFYGLATLFDLYLAMDVMKRHLSQKEKVLIAIVATLIASLVISIVAS